MEIPLVCATKLCASVDNCGLLQNCGSKGSPGARLATGEAAMVDSALMSRCNAKERRKFLVSAGFHQDLF